MMERSAHLDSFARDNLPPPEQWPDLRFDLPALHYPSRLNCVTELLDRNLARGDHPALITPNETLTYAQLAERVNRIANVLVQDMGMVPGNRVLLRSANTAWMVAAYFAVLKAGGIVVATMPLLRAKELGQIGWDAAGTFAAGFVPQVAQALRNILAVLAEAGCGPEHIARLTWFVVDMDEYRASLASLGPAYRAVMGRHFPAMSLVAVTALVEPSARVEIEATAILPG